MHLPSHNYVIMDIYADEELNEMVNGGDLDDGGDNARYFDDSVREVKLERSRFLLGSDRIEQDDEEGMMSLLLHFGDTMDPYDFKVPKAPYDWFDSASSISKGEPKFEK